MGDLTVLKTTFSDKNGHSDPFFLCCSSQEHGGANVQIVQMNPSSCNGGPVRFGDSL